MPEAEGGAGAVFGQVVREVLSWALMRPGLSAKRLVVKVEILELVIIILLTHLYGKMLTTNIKPCHFGRK